MTAVVDRPPAPSAAPPTPGVRTAWRLVGSLAVAAMLFWGVSETISLLAHEERTFERSFSADGVQAIELDVESGSVEVVVDETLDEIVVEARVSDGLRRTGHDQVLGGGTLRLTGTCPLWMSTFCSVRYDVRVPDADIDVVGLLSDGSLRVDGTAGTISASSDNGSIELFDVHGNIRVSSDNGSLRGDEVDADTFTAETDNGRVDVGFSTPPTSVTAHSENGSIELRLPEVEGGYRVDMDTDNGSTDLGVATDPGSDRLVSARTDNGSIRVLSTEGSPR
jgi:hypothetical protein